LKTIDLRNMSIHTKKCERMLELTSFMLDCVRINRDALNDISDKMGSLQTLAMRGVFGIQTGCLSSPQLKVLCLELATKAGAVKLDLPSLSKLQLKMACPEKLCITAPALKFIAFNLEVPECSAIKFEGISHLQELLYGASNFLSLSIICGGVLQNKLNFDIPCMRLGGDPNWLGVLNQVMCNHPRLSTMAGAFKLDLPSLTNFQLTRHTKEMCPDELCITAPALKLGELTLPAIVKEPEAPPPKVGWDAIAKPKEHSTIDYSRWGNLGDDLSDDEDEDEDERQYAYRLKRTGLSTFKSLGT
jgi:hypothetical protein